MSVFALNENEVSYAMKRIQFNVLLVTLSFSLTALCCCEIAAAQRVDSLGPRVRKYLQVSTPKVVLEHVQIIDGTGAPPSADRNIYIEDGKISRISAGADQSPGDGATILNLRGYSVMPGIVGMHEHLFYMARPNLEPRTEATTARPSFCR